MTAGGTLLTSVVSAFNALVALRNGRKLDAVHKSTNGLSERAEVLAKKLGVEEGRAAEKARSST